jgi:hypothetical protein
MATNPDRYPGIWVETFIGLPNKTYAGIGYTYDAGRDAFIPPKTFNSWTLNEDTCLWEAPTPMPVEEGKIFVWNEDTTSWVEFTPPT